jgi:hypothetical protein
VSSILVVERIMHNIRDSLGLATTPRPCEWFDFIGGYGTGGYDLEFQIARRRSNPRGRLIAILLGQLGLTVDECDKFYYLLARHGFRSKKSSRLVRLVRVLRGLDRNLSSKALEDAIATIVQQQCEDESCKNILQLRKDCPHVSFSFAKENACKT